LNKYFSYSRLRSDLENGVVTCQEVVEYYLSNIHNKKDLNVFLEVYDREAISRAQEIDKKLREGTQGRLAGMVIGIKDVLAYKDHRLQASSKILDGFKSQFTATAIQQLLNEDAIIIGHQNCDEFAMGSSNENSAFGPVRNAFGENLVPGGSSGGSAVSVQADMCLVSLGTDTGGSVRQPASFCGIVGLKPTYSRISRFGLAAYASSFDTIGILSNTVEDASLVLEICAGHDKFDSTSSTVEVPNYSKRKDFGRKARVAYLKDTLNNDGLNEEIKNATFRAIESIKSMGHEVEGVDFPLLDYILPTYYILTTAEASSNLSRYDGVKYGYRSDNAKNMEQMYKLTRSEGFGEEVKRRIMLGTFVLSARYHDAFYTKAQKVRRMIKEKTQEFLRDYDFIICPTTPTPPFEIGALMDNHLEMYLADLFTVQASVSGIPAISVPNGEDKNGLPIGLQIMGDYFKEDDLLAFSKEYCLKTA